MTREEAIQWIKVINTKEFGWDEYALQESQREIRERCEQGVREALDMAIEALSAEAVEVKAEQLPPKVPAEWINDGMVLVPQHDWIEMQKELEGYVSSDAVKVAYICDSRACNSDCELAECTHTTDIEHAKNFIRHGDRYMESAEREFANDQALEIAEKSEKIKSLEEEVSQLRQIINEQQETINTYGKIFQLQEAELSKLRGNK